MAYKLKSEFMPNKPGSVFTPSPHIQRRDQFGTLLSDMGLHGNAVEIGTLQGQFAEMLLSRWEGQLTCIDPWADDLEGYELDSIRFNDRDEDYRITVKALAPFGDRVTLVKSLSADAVNDFPLGSLDFVYIDGNHSPPFIREDLENWYPRVKPGGVLAGHDLNGDWDWSTQPALWDFHKEHGMDIYYVLGDAASWYLFAPTTNKVTHDPSS